MNIEVNNREIEAREGETVLTALKREGIHVPTLCYMDNLFPSGACRLCVVEVEGAPTLVPSCAFPVREGMKIQTHSPRAVEARKTIVELLLANHPDDCLYCPRNGSCQLQDLAEELGVRQRFYYGKKDEEMKIDISSPSIVRDPAKCILCGKCVRVCEEIQGVSAIDFVDRGSKTQIGTAFKEGLNVSSCVNCGQCILVCPTGSLREQSKLDSVIQAIQDPEKIVIVQHAPAISVTVGEEFGAKGGQDYSGILAAMLRTLGFDKVFDTSFTADLTIMEEGSELVKRIKDGGTLPMLTSCSPGWVKFVEQFYPDFIDNISTCKSPQQMMGAIIKHYYAEREGIDPEKIFSVSIMPCTAKKFEELRPEMMRNGLPDIDAVLTTRELVSFIKMYGLEWNSFEADSADSPFGGRSTAGKLFGATGGVMEAAIRSAHFLITGKELEELKVEAVRGLDGVKKARVKIGDMELGVAVASGLGNARKLLEDVKAGKEDLHFIEIMTCPGGCIAGGGQPIGTDIEAVKKRLKTLYSIDKNERMRTSHENPHVQRLYREFFGEPLSEKSHTLLHTHYQKRMVVH